MTNEASKDSTNIEVQMNFQGSVNGAAGKVERDMIVNPRQTVAESAVEIQQLLQILNRSYPSDIPRETQARMDETLDAIEKQPGLKKRFIGGLKNGGIEFAKGLLDNIYVDTLVGIYEGWQAPE